MVAILELALEANIISMLKHFPEAKMGEKKEQFQQCFGYTGFVTWGPSAIFNSVYIFNVKYQTAVTLWGEDRPQWITLDHNTIIPNMDYFYGKFDVCSMEISLNPRSLQATLVDWWPNPSPVFHLLIRAFVSWYEDPVCFPPSKAKISLLFFFLSTDWAALVVCFPLCWRTVGVPPYHSIIFWLLA